MSPGTKRRPSLRTRLALVIGALLSLTHGDAPAFAQSDWVPFREPESRASRPRRDDVFERIAPAPQGSGQSSEMPPLPPPLPPMNGWPNSGPREAVGQRPGDDRGPLPPAGSGGGYGMAYPGTSAPLPYGGARNDMPPASVQPPGTRQVLEPSAGGVERFELQPVRASDGSGLPQDTWRNADMKMVEGLLAPLALPPRSPAMASLFRRVMTSSAEPPRGGEGANHWPAVQLEALYRSGALAAMPTRLEATGTDPVLTAFRIRHALAMGQSASVCTDTKDLLARRADLPKQLRGEIHLLSGYCAAVDGNKSGAGLAATLARDEGIDAPLAIGALEAIGGDGQTGMPAPKRIHVLDYRLLEIMGPVEAAQVLERAEPALLASIALTATDPKLRVAAAELAAIAGAIDADGLASAYLSVADGADPVFRRAQLYKSITAEPAPPRKLAAARALLDETRKTPLFLPAAAAVARVLEGISPGPDTVSSGDIMIESALASGRLGVARAWANSAPALRHWLALVDIGDSAVPGQMREANLAGLDDLARRNRLSSDALHRLATVLDATDVNVPIPLWEAASRTPQPTTGTLPETGVLPQLADAAKKKDTGMTALLALRVLGGPARNAHIIALGDTIRALRRVGMDADARRVGVEALLADWPHGGGA